MKTALPFLLSIGLLTAVDLAGAGTAGPAGLVTEGQLPLRSGGSDSFLPVFSADGHHLAFVSRARNLVTNDDLAPRLNVYVHDRLAGTSTLISVNMSGVGGGDADANFPAISSNGQFIAFVSAANNLVPGDTNSASDVFVRDLANGLTHLVSVTAQGGSTTTPWLSVEATRPLFANPLISADGQRVVFESRGTNLTSLPDANNGYDVFIRDWQAGITRLVSINAAGNAAGNVPSDSATASADAGRVAFVSRATDLAAGVTTSQGDVYVRDLAAGVTVWASSNLTRLLNVPLAGYRCFDPLLSADGAGLAFKVSVAGQPEVQIVHFDLGSAVRRLVATNSTSAMPLHLSADGRFVVYQSPGLPSSSISQIYRWDALTESHVLVSVQPDGTTAGTGSSRFPCLSADGRRAAFISHAPDLVPGASNGASQIFVRDLETATTRLVTKATNGSASATGHDVALPVVSPDGRLVAFDSLAGDLVPEDANRGSDVFLYEWAADAVSLVSCAHPTRPLLAGVADCLVSPGTVSTDGRRVAFLGFDNSFVPDDTNAVRDAFVRDLGDGRLLPVTVGVPGVTASNSIRSVQISADGRYVAYTAGTWVSSLARRQGVYRRDLQSNLTEVVYAYSSNVMYSGFALPSISGDGAWVGFESAALDVVPSPPLNGYAQVFVRRMTSGTNQLVSVNQQGTGGGNGASFGQQLSADGRWVAFKSSATDLVAGSLGGTLPFFLRDLVSGTTELVAGGTDSGRYVFSADSRLLAYAESYSLGVRVIVRDVAGRTNVFSTNNCTNPSLGADGRWLVYESPASGGTKQIYARDLHTGQSDLISVNLAGTGGGNGPFTSAAISPDGRFVVFASRASYLVAGDGNGFQDVFVRNRALGKTLLLSQNLSGTGSGNHVSGSPVLSADGRTVVFHSYASDLVVGDYNDRRDVFVVRLASGDSDGDSLPDDWELAYFDTLSRDGSGDADGDGHTDRQEYLAGTDPTNRGSVLTVLTVQGAGTGEVTVLWSAVPGRTYRVQFKTSVEEEWDDLPGTVTPTTSTGSKPDDAAGAASHRFYRVVLVE